MAFSFSTPATSSNAATTQPVAAFSFSTPATSSNAATTQPLAAFSFANNKGMVYSNNKSFNNI